MSLLTEKKHGWRFPPGIDSKTGGIAATDLETDIKQSILILLSTRPGERIGRPGYGCGLLRFTFESVTYGLIKEIGSEITDTLRRWEDRIENVTVEPLTGVGGVPLVFSVRYCILETGARDEVRYELDIGQQG